MIRLTHRTGGTATKSRHSRPVLIGVIFAFAWNLAARHGPEMPHPDPGLEPTVATQSTKPPIEHG